jgi:uncharacterized protein
MLVLGHGAGGDITAPDLTALSNAAQAANVRVALITQPYRMAGRKAPAPATHLDEAWTAAVRHLTATTTLPVILGGRSSGARVACRTASSLNAAGVLCLAFPLHPPGKPDRSRAPELPTTIPTLVLNGDRDPFGIPQPTPTVQVITRPGATHNLKKDVATTAALAVTWLQEHGWAT